MILNRFATDLNKELLKTVPWSVRIAFGAPNLHMKDLTNASAVSQAVCCTRGMAREYLVRKSWMVRMYTFPDGVVGSGPTISSESYSHRALSLLSRRYSLFYDTT